MTTLILTDDGRPSVTLCELFEVLGLSHENTLDSVVAVTQEKFFQKKNTGERKERWELEELYPELRKQVMPLFDRLGMLQEVRPEVFKYNYALMLGALVVRVRSRLKHLAGLWRDGIRFNQIVFLGSERPLANSGKESPEVLVDCNNAELSFRDNWQPPVKLPTTELSMMQLVWDQANLPTDMREEVSVMWVNASMKPNPKGSNLLRPTTGDTVNEWLKLNPVPGCSLAVSNQPHVGYQHSAIRTFLPDSFRLTTVGAEANQALQVAFYLGELTRWLYQEKERRGKKCV